MLTDEAQKQAYDNVIKRLFERHAKEIIPLLLEEKDLARDEDKNKTRLKIRLLEDEFYEAEELNIEALVPPRRNDRVYRVPYEGEMHVVDIEIETSPNGFMALRSLIYHSLLMEKYREPIMSVILYPFKMPIVKSPLEDTNGDGESIAFRFRTLPLWRFEARKYFEQRNMCIFAFLPAMGGATQAILFQALDFMVQFYRDKQDEAGLREELIAFGVLLRRAAILSSANIEGVTKKMVNYDPFIMEDPHFGALINQKAEEKAVILAEEKAVILAEEKAVILAEEKAVILAEEKADILALAFFRDSLSRIVAARFPALAARMDKAALPASRDQLELLIVNVATALNEEAVRRLLCLSEN